MSLRKTDHNGYISIEKNPISQVGIFQYLGKSIDKNAIPDKIYNVYRPAEELKNAEAIESFKLVPLIDDHAMLGVGDPKMLPPESKGVHGATGDNVVFEDGVLYANLKIFSNFLADMLKSGKTALSLGYRCSYKKMAGLFNGEPYDYIQTNLRGNHIALVDSPRCNVWVLDQHTALDHFDLALDKEELNMADKDEDKMAKDRAARDERMDKVCDWAEKSMAKDAEEEKKKDDEAKDKAAKDKVEPTVKPTVDKSAKDEDKDDDKKNDKAKDESAEKIEGMDSAIKSLTTEIDNLKKGGMKAMLKEIGKRDELASQISTHVGTFDHSEMTLAEVAKYGAEKFALDCEAGHEQTAVSAYLKAVAAVKSSGRVFALDAKAKNAKGSVDSFLKDNSAA